MLICEGFGVVMTTVTTVPANSTTVYCVYLFSYLPGQSLNSGWLSCSLVPCRLFLKFCVGFCQCLGSCQKVGYITLVA